MYPVFTTSLLSWGGAGGRLLGVAEAFPSIASEEWARARGMMQMEAFRTGMEEMATAVRSLAAQLRAGGAQQAPAAGDDVSDAEMQNLAATVQYVRDENAQAIAECKGEIGRLQASPNCTPRSATPNVRLRRQP